MIRDPEKTFGNLIDKCSIAQLLPDIGKHAAESDPRRIENPPLHGGQLEMHLAFP